MGVDDLLSDNGRRGTQKLTGTPALTSPAKGQDDDAKEEWGVLTSVGPSGQQTEYVLQGSGPLVIGRDASSLIQLHDQRVSSTHCKFTCTLESSGPDSTLTCVVTITDCSTNGTSVNGRRLIKHRQHRLHHDDRIGIVKDKDDFLFTFVFSSRRLGRTPTIVPPRQAEAELTWQKGDLIARGGFGEVYLCINCMTGELLAVKSVHTKNLESEVEGLMREIELLKRLKHPNVVRYIGSKQQSSHTLDIVLEYVPGGSLAQLISRFGRFHEAVIARYTVQILRGLKYLHDNHVIHRDIKAANILVTDTGQVKLTDFGSALTLKTHVSDSQQDTGTQIHGTPLFMAPEVIRSGRVGVASDIWGVGCVVLEMASARPPWHDKFFDNPMAVVWFIGHATAPPDIPDKVSVDLRNFMEQCLALKWEERPDCAGLLKHPFIVRKSLSRGKDLVGGQLNLDPFYSPAKRQKLDQALLSESDMMRLMDLDVTEDNDGDAQGHGDYLRTQSHIHDNCIAELKSVVLSRRTSSLSVMSPPPPLASQEDKTVLKTPSPAKKRERSPPSQTSTSTGITCEFASFNPISD